jgi:hypothetical protein
MSAILDKKQPITATLAGLRTKLQNEWSQLERDLNMREHILKSIKNHPWEWAGCASLFGWLLSRIPVRKKRIYLYSSSHKPVKDRGSGSLGKLWRELWKISKPMIVAYLAKLWAENAKTPESKYLERRVKGAPMGGLPGLKE